MKYRAVGFDVDGTLVTNITYCWETFHERFGVSESIRRGLRQKYLKGLITYKEWGSREAAIWEALGIKRDDFVRVIRSMRLVEGAVETLRVLKQAGLFLFILSGTIRLILEQLLPDYGALFDRVAVSDIVFGEAQNPVSFDPGHPLRLERENKLAELDSLCEELGMERSELAFVGDNDNDAGVLGAVGLGIAFCPRSSRARRAADVVIEKPDLRKVIPHILGG